MKIIQDVCDGFDIDMSEVGNDDAWIDAVANFHVRWDVDGQPSPLSLVWKKVKAGKRCNENNSS